MSWHWKVNFRDSDYGRDLEMLISRRTPGGKREYIKRLEIGELDDSLAIDETAVTIPKAALFGEAPISTREIVQAIVNAAWDEGIRPAGAKDAASQVTAMQKHIDDLRMVVERTLPPPLPASI